jgi:uncharacterized membrane protein YkoI
MQSHRMKKWLVAGASISLLAGGTTAVAQGPSASSTRTPEVVITGTTADSVKAAILAAYPGATIQRMSTETDGKATDAYEAHVTKADGTHIEVFLDSAFNVTADKADKGKGKRGRGGHHGPGGPGGGSGEIPLTGATLDSVKAAVLAALPGATIDRATTENDGKATDAYEVKVTKADGTKAEVLLDSSFAVTAVNALEARGPRAAGARSRG